MVAALPLPGDDDSLAELQERWPDRRASKRAAKRAYQRENGRRIVVRSERLAEPDTARMSKALLAAQRELAQAAAERDARAQEHGDE